MLVSEGLGDVLKPVDFSEVYANKEYPHTDDGAREYVIDVFTLVNIKMIFRPLTKDEFVNDDVILDELTKGFGRKENPYYVSERIKKYMKDKGLHIK